MKSIFFLSEIKTETIGIWEQIMNMPIFKDSLTFGMLSISFTLTLVLIVIARITHRVGTSQFPTGFILPEKIEVKKESKVLKALTGAVPIEKEDSILMNHEYDGIHELDNDLPPWWKYGFYFCVVWAFCYMFFYHVSSFGPSSTDEYKAEMEEGRLAVEKYQSTLTDIINEKTVTILDAPGHIEAGKMIFESKCFPCHGMNAGGTNGPNLTDEYWIHGGGINQIFGTIFNGVPAKGMVPWGDKMSPKDIQKVASYIISLEGSNPEGGKAPEGNIWVKPETE